MMLDAALFCAFALPLLAFAAATVFARNPVRAVLFMIAAFISGAGVFLTLGAEFLAFIVLIVSVGAVAVLFLFVVMMLSGARTDFRRVAGREKAAALIVGGVLAAQISLAVWALPFSPVPGPAQEVDNVKALGLVLYTDFVFPFQVAGLVLLVAIVGAIVLALYPRRAAQRQNVMTQILCDPQKVVTLCNPKPGEGAP